MMQRVFVAAAVLILGTITGGSAMGAIKTETVEYTQGGVNFKGYLAYDDAAGPKRPGVLVVPEWWGLNAYAKSRAEQLAGLGYIAFAADMYGDGKTTDDPKVAPQLSGPLMQDRGLMRARVNAAYDQLKGRAEVDPAKIAAIGYCFGGTSVLELARSGTPVLGVVCFHGGLSTPNADDAKNIKGRVLVLTGANDAFIPAEQRDAFAKEMADAKVNWEMDVYSDAVHAFTNPNAGKFGIANIQYNKEADERSFARMRGFFDEIFGG
jgi:dienelactone hydrolase